MGRHRTAAEKASIKAQATKMRLAGVGVKRIAQDLHVDPVLVRALLVDVPPPKSLMRLRAKDDHRDAAIALRGEGRTYKEIQKELGVSKSSLSLWLRDLPHPTDRQRVELSSRQVEASDDLPRDRRGIARLMRGEGWLLREIAEEFDVTVKTAWVWCRGLPVPQRAKHAWGRDEIAAAGRAYWDAKRPAMEAERLAAIAEAQERVPEVTHEVLTLLAAVAYWCEGSKSKPWAKKERLTIINQDADVIRLFLAWLRRSDVSEERLTFRLNIHESADVAAATTFWAGVVGAPEEAFARPTLKRHNPKTVRHNVGADYHGCLVVDVRLSRDLYRQIEGTWRGIVAKALAAAPFDRA